MPNEMETANSSDMIQQTSNQIRAFLEDADLVVRNHDIKKVAETFTELEQKDVAFYKISSLTYDEEYPHREAFENIITAMDNPAFSFVYILSGEHAAVELYVGVIKNGESNLNASDYGLQLQRAFKGNFCGTEIARLSDDETEKQIFLKGKNPYKRAGVAMGVPSLNDNDDKTDFQGIDRLVNSMMGERWRLVIVCEPVAEESVAEIKNRIYEIYSTISSFVKTSVQFTENQSSGESKQHSEGRNQSDTKGKNEGYSEGTSSGSNKEYNSGGNSSGTNTGSNKSKTKGISTSHTDGTNTSDSEGTNWSRGTSAAISLEITNKKAQEALDYIDEELLERMKLAGSKGLFQTSVFYMSDKDAGRQALKSDLLSLCQGSMSSFSPMYACDMPLLNEDKTDDDYKNTRQLITSGYRTLTDADFVSKRDVLLLHSRSAARGGSRLATLLTPKEISLLAGLPMNEVAGINLKQGIEFGLNPNYQKDESEENKVALGPVIQRGQAIKNRILSIPKKDLNRHVFIAGVTGSGKTTTCQKILLNAGMPWMVIEPAKTEYRGMIGMNNDKKLSRAQRRTVENIVVFTVGNEQLVPFRFNPFELVEGENISSHIDMLKATFTTAFPMEASMPQLLEEGIYLCYKKKGWDVSTNKNKYTDNPFDGTGKYFPVLSELLSALEKVVEEKNFGAELRQNYVGSLVSRLSNLTVGSKGAMFNCPVSIDFDKLIDKNVIIEMEELKSQEDKALLMGFILTRLSVAVKKRHASDKSFRHITLVEEAHRLLSKMEYGDSGSKKASVEMFTDMLAEVRKYGESLVVVDQIPNKLAPEVMKNTNTKIIHRLFARDDKESVGDTMMMNDEQKMYLSSLAAGEAIVFTDATDKPVHIKVDKLTDTGDNEIEDDKIKEQWQKECDNGSLNNVFDLKNKFFIQYHPMTEETKEIIKAMCKKDYDGMKEFKKKLREVAKKENTEISYLWAKLSYTLFVMARGTTELCMDDMLEKFTEFYEDYVEKDDTEYNKSGVNKTFNYYKVIGAM